MLHDHLPKFVTEFPDMAELLAAEQPEVDALAAGTASVLEEFFVDGITEKTIDLWEDLLGFAHAPEWPVRRRADRIKARLMANEKMTAETLKALIERVGGVECTVTEDADHYAAHVQFVGRFGIPAYLDDIKKEVELVRPYHIVVDYAFLFTLLRHYADHTLQSLGGYTLVQLRDGAPLQKGGVT